VLETLPRGKPRLETIVLQCGHLVYGHSARTGELLWKTTGPLSVSTTGTIRLPHAKLVPATQDDALPAVTFQFDSWNALRAAVNVNGAQSPAEPRLRRTSTVERRPDPRLIRRPGWEDNRAGDRLSMLTGFCWMVTLALGLYWMPCGVMWKMLRQGRWSLRTFLLLPVFAGIYLVLLRVPLSDWVEPRVDPRWLFRLQMGLTGLPVIFFVAMLRNFALRRHWRAITFWGIIVIVLMIGWTKLAMWMDSATLAPGERFQISSWHVPFIAGVYCAAVLAIIVTLVDSLLKWRTSHLAKKRANVSIM